MSCKASVRHVGDVVVVDISGRLTLGDGSGMIRNTIKDLVTGGERKILLNLKDVSYMDSAGLGEMVGAYASVSNIGGHIKLLNTQAYSLSVWSGHQFQFWQPTLKGFAPNFGSNAFL